MGDIFDEAINLEDQYMDDGFDEGVLVGEIQGRVEGYSLGIHKGWEIGQKIGYHFGCLALWKALPASMVSSRCEKALAAYEALIQSFPPSEEYNPQSEELFETLDKCAAKHKQIVSLLGVSNQPSSATEQQQKELSF